MPPPYGNSMASLNRYCSSYRIRQATFHLLFSSSCFTSGSNLHNQTQGPAKDLFCLLGLMERRFIKNHQYPTQLGITARRLGSEHFMDALGRQEGIGQKDHYFPSKLRYIRCIYSGWKISPLVL